MLATFDRLDVGESFVLVDDDCRIWRPVASVRTKVSHRSLRPCSFEIGSMEAGAVLAVCSALNRP